MTTRLNPYLTFDGNARDAMEFYASVLGGELNVLAFADMGGMDMPEEKQHLVMHSDLSVNDGVMLMGSDAFDTAAITNGTVSLSGDDGDTLRAWFAGLAEGGTINVPLEVAPWGDPYGQLTDKFGISWMVNIGGDAPAA
ncbi:MAG: VOC family protein [Nocardioides sp.]